MNNENPTMENPILGDTEIPEEPCKHSLSDHQVSETWYGDEVQRQYLSTVYIY